MNKKLSRLTRLRLLTFPLLLLVATEARSVEVTITPIGDAFAANSMNHVAFRQNAIKTVGDQQFTAYYDNTGVVTVARRTLGTSDWGVFNTVYTDNNSNLTDDHNVITFGVDGDGYMHLSWGMHNNDLRYIKSATPVTGPAPITFGTEIPMTGAAEGLVTYPQFYDLPGGDLLFMYRTGSSGNGDTQLNRYDNATDSWSALHRPLFDGSIFGDGLPSVNAYANTLAFDSQGDLHFTWTVRDTPDFQTNKNIYYAKSTDDGATWLRGDGSAYPLPFGEVHSDLAVAIPEQSSLINQTSMTVDSSDRPVVASWWAPGAQQGDHTRQYMLAYHDGASWQTSQITNRAPEPKQGGGSVRDLARPIVVVDDDDRVIVAMRYDERSDVVTIAHSEDRQNWDFVDLTTEGMGTWEPNYDVDLWERENKLHLLYQPVGLGQQSSTISVLEWDAQAYFDGLNGPRLSMVIDRFTGEATIQNTAGTTISVDSLTISSAGGQLAPGGWVGLADQGAPDWQTQSAGSTQLAETSPGLPLSVEASASFSIGNPYSENPVAFGDSGPAGVTFEYQFEGETFTGTVDFVGESRNNLSLIIDPESGKALLVNSSDFGVEIEAYTVISDAGGLQPSEGGWQSLDDSDEAGGDWAEANPSATRVSELKESGVLALTAGDGFDLGYLFDTASEQDLVFEFLLAGEASPTRGVVRYASLVESLPGDFNDDGLVDGADYTAWRDRLGMFVDLANDLTPGFVTASDYEDWQANYGASAGSSSSTSVPEPSAWGLMLLSLAFRHLSCAGRGS